MNVSSVSSNASLAGGTSSQSLAGITGADFMQILIKQLQYQDPFEPMSNADMVGQMATIRELETNTRLGSTLEQITDQQRFASAASLIGKYVSGSVTDAQGNAYQVEGVVTGVQFTERGRVMLELDTGTVLPMSALEHVTDVDAVMS